MRIAQHRLVASRGESAKSRRARALYCTGIPGSETESWDSTGAQRIARMVHKDWIALEQATRKAAHDSKHGDAASARGSTWWHARLGRPTARARPRSGSRAPRAAPRAGGGAAATRPRPRRSAGAGRPGPWRAGMSTPSPARPTGTCPPRTGRKQPRSRSARRCRARSGPPPWRPSRRRSRAGTRGTLFRW